MAEKKIIYAGAGAYQNGGKAERLMWRKTKNSEKSGWLGFLPGVLLAVFLFAGASQAASLYETSLSPNKEAEELMHFPMAWRILEDLLFLDTEPELPVSVGVIDTVFSTQTPDLHYGGALYAFTEQELRESIAKEKEDSKPYKQKVHGTHVAGIIGSDGYTKSGIDGVYPYAWHRKIMTDVSRLFLLSEWGAEAAEAEPRDGKTISITAQLDLLFRNGVKVINCSMGYGGENKKDTDLHEDDGEKIGKYLQAQLDAGKDFVICCSAGNEGLLVTHPDAEKTSWYANVSREKYPDVYDRIIVVGNCNTEGKLAWDSSEGERMDILAVGKDIVSLIPGGGTKKLSGTSQASPYVSAVAAMVWTAAPHLTGAEVKNIIVSSSMMSEKYAKVLNAEGALRLAVLKRDPELEKQAAQSAPPEETFELKFLETPEKALERYYTEVLVKKYGQVSAARVIGDKGRMHGFKPSLLDDGSTGKACELLSGMIGYHVQVMDETGSEDMIPEMVAMRTQADSSNGGIRLECFLDLYQVHDGRVALMDTLELEAPIVLRVDDYPNLQIGLFLKTTAEHGYLIWGIEASGKSSVYRFGTVTIENGILYQRHYYGSGEWTSPIYTLFQKISMSREDIQAIADHPARLALPVKGKTIGSDSLRYDPEDNRNGTIVQVPSFRKCFHTQFKLLEKPARLYRTPIAQLCVNTAYDDDLNERWLDIDAAGRNELLKREEKEEADAKHLPYEGEWHDKNGRRISMLAERMNDDQYMFYITEENKDGTLNYWSLLAEYDYEQKTLVYSDGVLELCRRKGAGSEMETLDVLYMDGEGHLRMVEDTVFWVDETGNAGEGCAFVRGPLPESTDLLPDADNSSSEADDSLPRTDASSFEEYLNTVLVPAYGRMDTSAKYSADYTVGWETEDLSGILIADVKDYDGDGSDEMLTVRFDPLLYEADPHTGNRETAMILEMYEKETSGIVQRCCLQLTAYGYQSAMDTAGTFTAVFTYPYEGSLRIAIDHFYMVMEYTTTLAVYEYDGNDLVFLSDNGYVQTGQGDLLARYAQYDPGEAAALTCSEWRGIMAGDTAWQTLEKYDIEEHDWAAASPDDEARIRDLYTALLEEEGLAVSDHRTLIHVSDAEMNGYNSDYDLRQAVTPDQVYQPVEGELTNLGWLFSYQAMGGPLTLERVSEGSL